MTATDSIWQAGFLVLTALLCCAFAEIFGYWLHRLLHSNKLPWLSRNHMVHHLQIYGPQQPLRADGYKDATGGRFSIGKVGLEWLAPSAVILGLCWGAMAVAGVPRRCQIVALVTLLLWPIFTFNYLHDRMHLSNFWMTRIPLLRSWFLQARRLHDIHHRRLDDAGRMDSNFGIGFFLFDRLFGTMAIRHQPFNWKGYQVARTTYAFLDLEVAAQRNRLDERRL